MNQNLRISVIVPVYNVEQYLPRCVESILAQIYENLEILLVTTARRTTAAPSATPTPGRTPESKQFTRKTAV